MNAMIRLHDHVIDRRSGRPEPHVSWQTERLTIWSSWAMAASFLALSAYVYAEWRDLQIALSIFCLGILHFVIGYVRRRALDRKKRELCKAVAAHDAILAKAAQEIWERNA